MDQRFGLTEEFLAEARRGQLERRIGTDRGHQGIELRGSVTIARADPVGILEDQVNRDPQQRQVGREQRHARQLALEGPREIGREKAGAGDVVAHVARQRRIFPPGNQPVPQDDVGRESLHDQAVAFAVEVMDRRYARSHVGGHGLEVGLLKEDPVRRHGP